MKLKGQEKLQSAKRSYGFLKANFTRLGIPDPALTLRAPMDEFEDALNAAEDKNTGEAATIRKDAAEAAFDKAFRNFGNEYLEYNHLVTDEDKSAADWHRPKDPEPMPRPDDEPEIEFILTNKREVGVKFRRKGAKRHGKPMGIGALVFRWGLFDREPTDISELVNVETITKSPFTLTFKESDRGKRLYFVACWQINRGRIEGPMTEIRFVIIP
jgi:hypothetical protein